MRISAITAQRRRLESVRARRARPSSGSAASCDAEQARKRTALDAERAALAAQVRAQYMIGRADELQAVVEPDQPGRGGPHGRVSMATLRARARRGSSDIDVARDARSRSWSREIEQHCGESQVSARTSRAARSRGSSVRATSARGASPALERAGAERQPGARAPANSEEQAVESLVADLARVLRIFRWTSTQSFEQLRGKLPWPVRGQAERALSGDARPTARRARCG